METTRDQAIVLFACATDYARWQRSTDDRMLASMNAAQSVQTGLETDSANG